MLVRPRDIFAALPNKPWSYLRAEQGEVLEGWYGRRDDRDVVIKQNTGGGKTVVGLLIAQSTINEGVGKAVYLAPDTYLATRVRAEAAQLGLQELNCRGSTCGSHPVWRRAWCDAVFGEWERILSEFGRMRV